MTAPFTTSFDVSSSSDSLFSLSGSGSFTSKVETLLELENSGTHTLGLGTVDSAFLVALKVVSGSISVTVGGESFGTYGAGAAFIRCTPVAQPVGAIVLTHADDAVVSALLLG